MTNKGDKFSGGKRKKKNRWIDGIIVLIFILLAGSVVWIGKHEWNMRKALDSLQVESGSSGEFQEIESPEEQNTKEAEKPEDMKLRETEDTSDIEKGQEEAEDGNQTGQPANPTGYIEGQQLPEEPMLVNGILLANKQYPMPKDYAPEESKEAREAFEEMKAAAVATAGINLQAFSTYRSYDYQVTLYNRYVERDGQKAADRYSARPGYSEHQTGLAFDIGEVNHERYWASNSFGDTEAAKWLAANAHRFGFILRYPEGKEGTTGYMHESWHYRFVGREIAEQIFKQNITLEEYLGVQ